ncbi:SNARE-binding exocyst subunit S6 [Orbilia oligospora]|uniref:SNARE-binding exocyst subunit S6 n=1 Tax=Orbilia oligospora TaxID=2813651 RepID=A0A7C8NJR3_ORBOL|nr:SNARE-binding exocyst subunit S6 [Orbilia oligospora]
MEDAQVKGTAKLAETLRHPDDLERISALKAQYTSDKAAIDAQLKAGVQLQLDAGMKAVEDSQKDLNLIREELVKIDRLCSEAQTMIKDFPLINEVSRVHRNFTQVEEIMTGLANLNKNIEEIEQMLNDDNTEDGLMGQMPNLLPVHYKLGALRDFRDDAIFQATRATDDTSNTLANYFAVMDDAVTEFESRLDLFFVSILDMVRGRNVSLVVRIAKIIEAEETADSKLKALQDATSQHSDLVSRFKSINVGSKQQKEYKKRYIACIKSSVAEKFREAEELFQQDSSTLLDSFEWYFDDLFVVKDLLTKLVPPKWKIFDTYLNIYHGQMHEFITKLVGNQDLDGQGLLQIILWKGQYNQGLKQLKVDRNTLDPPVLGVPEEDLVKEYLSIIVSKMTEWMNSVNQSDVKEFQERKEAPDTNESGNFILQGAIIAFQMINQQIDVASDAGKVSVLLGVIDECAVLLKKRQAMWEDVTRKEVDAYLEQPETIPEGLFEWMMAVANDQARCAVFTEAVKSRLVDALPKKAQDHLEQSLGSVVDGFVDMAGIITKRITEIIFNDLKAPISAFFTPEWYGTTGYTKHMESITVTIESYLSDCKVGLDSSIAAEVALELSEMTVISYLSSVRNKNAKFLLQTADVAGQVRSDVMCGFGYFRETTSLEAAKQTWPVIEYFIQLAVSPKEALWETYCREDSSRELLGVIKNKMKEFEAVEIGAPTIMGKVKVR